MQLMSLAWGVLAAAFFCLGFIPCLGAVNWINIPFAAVGFCFALYAHMQTPPTGNRNPSLFGMILCAVAVIVGAIRLAIGGGVL